MATQTRFSHLHDEPRYSWAPLAMFAVSFALWDGIILAGKQAVIWALAFAHWMGWL